MNWAKSESDRVEQRTVGRQRRGDRNTLVQESPVLFSRHGSACAAEDEADCYVTLDTVAIEGDGIAPVKKLLFQLPLRSTMALRPSEKDSI